MMIATQAFAYTESAERIIQSIDKPYAVTHLKALNVDCVWTKDDQGYLQNENYAPEGTGVCWGTKAVNQVQALDKAKKLVWHSPLNHPPQDENSKLIEKLGAAVNGCTATQMQYYEMISKLRIEYKNYPNEFNRGMKLGYHLAEIGDFNPRTCNEIIFKSGNW